VLTTASVAAGAAWSATPQGSKRHSPSATTDEVKLDVWMQHVTGNRGAQTYDFENFSGNDGRAIATVAHYPGPSTWNPVQPTAVAVLEVPGTAVAVRP
jgi:hypothetical protein